MITKSSDDDYKDEEVRERKKRLAQILQISSFLLLVICILFSLFFGIVFFIEKTAMFGYFLLGQLLSVLRFLATLTYSCSLHHPIRYSP